MSVRALVRFPKLYEMKRYRTYYRSGVATLALEKNSDTFATLNCLDSNHVNSMSLICDVLNLVIIFCSLFRCAAQIQLFFGFRGYVFLYGAEGCEPRFDKHEYNIADSMDGFHSTFSMEVFWVLNCCVVFPHSIRCSTKFYSSWISSIRCFCRDNIYAQWYMEAQYTWKGLQHSRDINLTWWVSCKYQKFVRVASLLFFRCSTWIGNLGRLHHFKQKDWRKEHQDPLSWSKCF